MISYGCHRRKLDTKLGEWKPEISAEVPALVSQVIDAAESDALDLMRSRAVGAGGAGPAR